MHVVHTVGRCSATSAALGSNRATWGLLQALSMLECGPASCGLGFHASAVQTPAAEAFRQ